MRKSITGARLRVVIGWVLSGSNNECCLEFGIFREWGGWIIIYNYPSPNNRYDYFPSALLALIRIPLFYHEAGNSRKKALLGGGGW